MKEIMISIKPKYCELIASGKKTIEIRKTAPKPPFKAFIYQTKSKWIFKLLKWLGLYQGKVIGEFVCEGVASSNVIPYMISGTCLSKEEYIKYTKWKKAYRLDISDLKMYGNPKELSEFRKPCNHKTVYGMKVSGCGGCRMWRMNYKTFKNECVLNGKVKTTRPPQSWMYCEYAGEKK